MSSSADNTFPKAFHCYKPFSALVFGSICMTPDNKVLLVKGRQSNKWSFPKGHKESGETYIDCCTRETMEETGVDLSNRVPVAYQRLSAGEYYFYEMEEVLPVIQDCNEISEARWVSISEMRSLNCNVDVNAFLSRMKREMGIFKRRAYDA